MASRKVRRIGQFLVLWILFAGVFTHSLYAQTVPSSQPAPYQKDEFPPWALDLRRAEIVAFGVLPFTVFFTSFAVDSYRFADHSWDFRYAPWPLKSAGAVLMDQNQMVGVFMAGVLGAAVIALADYWIHGSKLRALKQKEESQSRPDFSITREPLPLPPSDLPPVVPPAEGP
jgi:hypothetical protein